MDLNICIEDNGIRDPDKLIQEKIDRCKQLGFNTIALSVVIDLASTTSVPDVPPPPQIRTYELNRLDVRTRLTAKVTETLQLYQLNKSPHTSKYDLIALEPQNSKLLQYIAGGSASLDILTLNLTERFDLGLNKTRLKVLQDRGICFEINYGPAQLGSSLRRNIICNGQNLVEKTLKNLILSNGTQDIFRLRGPKDAMSLGVLFLVPPKRCHDLVFKNARMALEASKHRANPISSAIEIVQS